VSSTERAEDERGGPIGLPLERDFCASFVPELQLARHVPTQWKLDDAVIPIELTGGNDDPP
jgi:hypothetical protein